MDDAITYEENSEGSTEKLPEIISEDSKVGAYIKFNYVSIY